MEKAGVATAPAEGKGLPFQLRGSLQTLLCLRLLRPDDPDFFRLLLDKIAHAPDFFRSAPVLLDVAVLGERAPDDLGDLVERLRQQRLVPVGIQNGTPAWNDAAGALGLALFGAGGAGANPAERREPQTPAQGKAGGGLVIAQPVRGGQQVLADGGDLVVTAPVGHGAEVAAAGHIHVYAPLRGRAFAGINGDEGAMIFCDQLHAELVSIAGIHLVSEAIEARFIGRRVRIRCHQERLVIDTPS
ncbi:MAG: septum site-determining protein MinC [Geminicoccaceae bacterium]|nr:septum site-determining protein MinC [Geminicoccaceae bacterium]